MFPLLLVLSVTAIKDAHEDQRRRKSDREENERPTSLLKATSEIGETPLRHSWTETDDGVGTPPGQESASWEDLRPGDIIKVHRDEAIPADIVLLTAVSDDGRCFISTANIDGESTLKPRRVVFTGCTSAIRR